MKPIAEESKAKVTAVYDAAAATYNLVGPSFFLHFGRRLANIVGIAPGSKVLDVATGTGAVFCVRLEELAWCTRLARTRNGLGHMVTGEYSSRYPVTVPNSNGSCSKSLVGGQVRTDFRIKYLPRLRWAPGDEPDDDTLQRNRPQNICLTVYYGGLL
jgi:hypothetical protein